MSSTPAESDTKKTLLSQGIELVRFLAHSRHALGVTEIAEGMGLPKSSTFRLLGVLIDLGFVQKNMPSQRYTISPKIFSFVHDLTHEFGPNQRVGELIMERAEELGCGIYLSMLSGRCTYVISAAGMRGNTFALGSTGPIHASSAGKVIVAHLPESEWAYFEPTPEDARLTPYTNLDPARFRQELCVARESGVGWNMRETTPTGASVAALIRETFYPPRLAVALLVNFKDLVVHDRARLEEQARALAKRLEKELGAPKPMVTTRG